MDLPLHTRIEGFLISIMQLTVLRAPSGRLLYGIADIRLDQLRLFKLRPLVCHLSLVIKGSLGVIYIQELADEHGGVFQKPKYSLGWANAMVSGG